MHHIKGAGGWEVGCGGGTKKFKEWKAAF